MSVNFDDPVKHEVWQSLRALNNAWTKGNPGDLKNHFHKDMVAITATDRERLEGREACITSWNNFAKAQDSPLERTRTQNPDLRQYSGDHLLL